MDFAEPRRWVDFNHWSSVRVGLFEEESRDYAVTRIRFA
jgi:hypothetical protein